MTGYRWRTEGKRCLRDAVIEARDRGSGGSVSCVKDNFNLGILSSLGFFEYYKNTNLHWTSINKKPVELLECIGGTIRLVEDDGGNTAADSIRSIGNGDALDTRSNRFGEVFLE